MQFYPRDWLAHPGLRMCSLAARGLWIDMMSLMHSGEPYGYLTHKGKDILPPVLARLVGVSLAEMEGYLHELIDHGVVSQTEDGTFFSGRMVKDEHNRQVRAAGGVKSLDNPNVPQPRKDRGKDTFRPSPAVASASASASANNTSSSRAEVESWWPAEYRPDLDDFLDRVLNSDAKRLGWLRNLILLKSGERTPPPRNPEHMGMGLRAMLANTDRPNWNYYVGCVDNAGAPKADAPRNAGRASDDGKGEALLLLGELRQQVVSNTTGHGTTRHIPSAVINGLPPEVRAALEAAGGARKLANVDDEKYGMMAAQFASAYSAKKQRGTKSEPTRISAILPEGVQ